MSYGQNGMNGYGNGYGGSYRTQQPPSRYDDDYRNGGSSGSQASGPVGSRRARRAGGYGGFFNEEAEQQQDSGRPAPAHQASVDPYNAPAVPTWRRGAVNDGYGASDRDRLRTPPISSSRMYGDGPGGRQIEGVVQHINEKWGVLTKSECVPVHLALQLMDDSSLGRGNDYDDFQRTSKALQKALKAIVNEHHQGFNSSIGTFHKIQTSIQTSQTRVRTLKGSLVEAKANLMGTKPELKGLATASQSYDEMLQIFSQVEKIQAMPEVLDARISDKHFLTAVDTLQDALRLIRNSNLENIGALSDLRVYLNNQETSLTDTLLEELHDHLYLKSPYTQGRWKAYSASSGDTVDAESIANMSTGIRPLYRFLTGLNVLTAMSDDVSRNPEEDTFEYLHMLVEALNKMGCLELAVDRINQRLPIELFGVVEKTNQEVDQRHPAHLRNAQTGPSDGLNIKNSAGDSVLNDLLYTLYSKFEAIAEGHRAVHEVVLGIIQREGLRKTIALTGGFKELWKLLQSEMRSLLHDYLATDGNNLYTSRDTAGASANIFKRNHRDKSKRVFKLGEMDKKSVQLASAQDDLDKILQASVPGLVNKPHARTDVHTGERVLTTLESAAAGHKLLIDPSVFNISALLPPSLVFLQRLKDIVPPDSDIAVSTLTSFLDDFLVNVFNPQLEETVTDLCSQCFMESSSFQQDTRWTEHARMPIFKGASLFFSLIKAFCKMLENIPQDQTFTQLIITQLRTYYERCLQWYISLAVHSQSDGPPRPKPAAAILEGSDLAITVRTIWEGDGSDRERLMSKEVEMIIAQTNEKPIDPFDIICDRRTGTALCLLYSSMQWLSSQLESLREVKKGTAHESKQARQDNRWTMFTTASMRDTDQPVALAMTKESVG